ncbi:hypothetical protein [Bradyrhizobium sp. JYMT SZCCT0428]|uniref:hypothetical protein n=1 Tax=Bradyrhizobium sp. JYMT SZCCT0428 TaxID=2807673 RepID=UPI001BA74177|nr:hypothetical protein [Bradyrhizobium sp. JYMT SZCCT0428]MBR1151706.1 hypothetical protein [Bradyrhizobium sp. JYMT SZCCT0428]
MPGPPLIGIPSSATPQLEGSDMNCSGCSEGAVQKRTRLLAAKRRREERQDAGKLVPIEPIERVVASSLRAMRDRLLNFPGQVAYLVAHRPQEEVYETLDGAIRETLEEIASPDFPTRVAAAGLAAAANGRHHGEDADVETEE